MNHADFKTWLRYHATAFTGITGWLARFPQTARSETEPTQADILASWERTLKFTELGDATKATDLLASGDEHFSERTGYDHHPRDVRRVAMGFSGDRHRVKNTSRLKRMIDGEETYACPKCFDVGAILCVHPKSLRAAGRGKLYHEKNNPEGTVPYYTCARACECRAGDSLRERTDTISTDDLLVPENRSEWWEHVTGHIDELRAAATKATEFDPNAW